MYHNGRACECETVESLASDPQCPIEYDKKLGEYNLLSLNKKARYRIYYCFFCGGKLPDSKRINLFTEPSEEEKSEVVQALSAVTTMQQARSVLGEPDETTDAPAASPGRNGRSGKPYKRHYLYRKRWRTLDLTIRERSDGSIESAFTGKYKGSQGKRR